MLRLLGLAAAGLVVAALVVIGYVVFALSQPVTPQTAEAAGLRFCRIAKVVLSVMYDPGSRWPRSDCRCLSSSLVKASGEAQAAALLETGRRRVVAGLTGRRDENGDAGANWAITALEKADAACWIR
jgi:hypothetical protein